MDEASATDDHAPKPNTNQCRPNATSVPRKKFKRPIAVGCHSLAANASGRRQRWRDEEEQQTYSLSEREPFGQAS